MKAFSARLLWLAALPFGLNSLAGCGLIYEYPKKNSEQSAAACQDGIDNDLDGRADCFDSSCVDFCKEESASSCADGIDNDADGDIDCHDGACAAFCLETSEAACKDRQDNDADGKVDCADSDCAAHCPEQGAVACADKLDNDHDGLTDCQDNDCDGFCPEQTFADCQDQRDNDGDGLSDGADPLCWPVRPPDVVRCAGAPATDFLETFDSHAYFTPYFPPRWFEYGITDRFDVTFDNPLPVVDYAAHSGARSDDYVRLTWHDSKTGVFETDLGGMVSARTFSGRWQDLSLSAQVLVPGGSQLHLMLAPPHLAPQNAEPLAGAELAQLTISMDASIASPTLALIVEGQSFSTKLPPPPACGLSACDNGWATLSLTVEDDRFTLLLKRPGQSALVNAPLPGHDSFKNSRLVIRGGTTDRTTAAGIDDLSLSIAAGTPCQVAVPQLPAASCEAALSFSDYGYGVSVAPSGKDYCALVVAGNGTPTAVSAWRSSDGVSFESAPLSIALPEGAAAHSAALAAGDALGVVVSYFLDDQLQSGLAMVDDCSGKVELAEGPTLPVDSEELSYVVASGRHELYFTRPPTNQTERTLWRLAADSQSGLAAQTKPQLLAELPPGVSHPATVQRIGVTDLVLSAPTLPTEGPPGATLLVSSAAAKEWLQLEPSPLLAGASDPGFDEQGVRAVAVASAANGGFLLYGGANRTTLMTGTARLDLAGVAPPALPQLGKCGDGVCASKESCTTCAADCPCAGPTLLTDVLHLDAGWQYVGGYKPEGDFYFDKTAQALNWASTSDDTWLALPLKAPVSGDFELSFDLSFESSGELGQCDSAYLGLGTMPGPATKPFGVFTKLTFEGACSDELWLSPYVRTADEEFKSFGPTYVNMCRKPELKAPLERKQRVLLRRSGGEVTVILADSNACESGAHLHYSGALPELSTLMLGAVDECGLSTSGRVTNLELRLSDDPEHCPKGEQVCGSGEAAGCTDTKTSQEHCGGCDQPCTARHTCVGGECACAPNYLLCDATCVDPNTDKANCGACGTSCDGYCLVGQCDVGETCAAPAALPSGSTKAHFDIWKPAADIPKLCKEPSLGDAFFTWTAERSGSTVIEVQGTDGPVKMELGITTDAGCATYDTCESFTSDLGGGEHLRFDAKAGTEYRIAVSIVKNPLVGEITDVELRIEAP